MAEDNVQIADYCTDFADKTGQLSAYSCTFLILLQLRVNYKPIFLPDNTMQPLSYANMHFNQQGTPFATDFDDIYFSNDGGLAETDYVFLQQNDLPQRWHIHSLPYFHIIETGFGTGTNFLLTWHRFRQFCQQQPGATCRKLYFSSVEKFPLSRADLSKVLHTHPELAELCLLLLAQYPPAINGCHRLQFDNGQVILDLWLGDANELLPQIPDNNQADAFFLDGFAPSKNPDMWQPSLFEQLARLSHQHTTVATFTCAGLVKRGLRDSGFSIKKVKGFGPKREMLTAKFNTPIPGITAHILPEKVCIVGGGIASLCLALQLVNKGITTQLLCADAQVAQGASHNLQGAVYPNLHPTITLASLLHCQAFYFSRHFYQQLASRGCTFAMQWCGVLHLASNPALASRQHNIIERANWPGELVQPLTAEEASKVAGVTLSQSGIFLPQAGWLSPQQFCQAALALLQQSELFSAHFSYPVSSISYQQQQWHINSTTSEHTQPLTSPCLVLANGADLTRFTATASIPVNRVRGQVSHVRSNTMASLSTVLCHKGYITPQLEGCHAVGATFDRDADSAFISGADDEENLALVNSQLQQPDWFADAEVIDARAAFRATVSDRLPLMGAPENSQGLYVLGGFGARGVLLAPLLAETLACHISGQPLPMTSSNLQAIAARRFSKSAATT
jgi:tRNA 5-methylaminomethyl-2-thiouridine biosynthesis bifunctional protein